MREMRDLILLLKVCSGPETPAGGGGGRTPLSTTLGSKLGFTYAGERPKPPVCCVAGKVSTTRPPVDLGLLRASLWGGGLALVGPFDTELNGTLQPLTLPPDFSQKRHIFLSAKPASVQSYFPLMSVYIFSAWGTTQPVLFPAVAFSTSCSSQVPVAEKRLEDAVPRFLGSSPPPGTW